MAGGPPRRREHHRRLPRPGRTGRPPRGRAAARGTGPDLSELPVGARAGDGIDLCYVKDCARAIALLHLTDRLAHRTYDTERAVADYLAWLRAGNPR
ncbi:hypothetical protein ABZ897_18145 [Nonomuraea sp. NPDC046802]|uniref:hypothetical protein n=1 Tax=Nonomuraea sp. NPDC046802 TaxID=3154919 RepID=UPI0033EF6E8F